MISGVLDFVCIRTLKGKQPQLSIPNVVDVTCVTISRQGQRSKSRGNQMRYRRGHVRRYDCLGFLVVSVKVLVFVIYWLTIKL